MAGKIKKKYTFQPNRNTAKVFAVLVLLILAICGIRACTKYDRSLRGAKYAEELVNLPEFQVRACLRPDGTPTANYLEIYPEEAGSKVIYLTFDDGPSSKVTPQILDILKQHNVKATFFMVAKNAEQYPDIVKRVAQEGHSVASHSYSHDYETMYLDVEAFRAEIHAAKEALINIVGEDNYTDIFRFPGGAFREEKLEFKEVLIQENIPYVNWNCLTGDSETKNPVSANLIARAKSTAASAGSGPLILLMHDAGAKQATADALPAIIENFKSEGYQFEALKRK